MQYAIFQHAVYNGKYLVTCSHIVGFNIPHDTLQDISELIFLASHFTGAKYSVLNQSLGWWY